LESIKKLYSDLNIVGFLICGVFIKIISNRLFLFKQKENDSGESVWDPVMAHGSNDLLQQQYRKSSASLGSTLSISALRQLEALFNLTQLLFGLSRAETVNFTFRDLQFKKHPHSFKRAGFKKLNTGTVCFVIKKYIFFLLNC
jgi:hypothetical protein